MSKNILENFNLKETLQSAQTKKKEKSYDELVRICSDILLELPHNENSKELLKELPSEDFSIEITTLLRVKLELVILHYKNA